MVPCGSADAELARDVLADPTECALSPRGTLAAPAEAADSNSPKQRVMATRHEATTAARPRRCTGGSIGPAGRLCRKRGPAPSARSPTWSRAGCPAAPLARRYAMVSAFPPPTPLARADLRWLQGHAKASTYSSQA